MSLLRFTLVFRDSAKFWGQTWGQNGGKRFQIPTKTSYLGLRMSLKRQERPQLIAAPEPKVRGSNPLGRIPKATAKWPSFF
jgi:hypothetical protein